MVEEDYKLKTNKEILAEALLYIEGWIPVKVRNDGVDDFESAFSRSLCFENIDGPKILRSCIDLIEDTESAIVEFYRNGLCLQTEISKSKGEMYLRLYGLLNSVSLQIEAIIELIELFKVPNKNQLKDTLKDTEIYKIRNKLGSHTTKYSLGGGKFDSFRLTQTSLSKWGKGIEFSGIDTPTQNINLFDELAKYNKISEVILLNICTKALKSRIQRRWKR